MNIIIKTVWLITVFCITISITFSQYTTKWEVVNSVSDSLNFYKGNSIIDYCNREQAVVIGRNTNSLGKFLSNQVLKYNILNNEIKIIFKDTVNLTDDYESIVYPSEDVIAFVGSMYDTIVKVNSTLYKRYYGILNLSIDSGNTWNRMSFDSNTIFKDIAMLDSKTGLILQQSQNNFYNKFETKSDTLLFTNDCWRTYQKIGLPKDRKYFSEVLCISSEQFLLLGWDITSQNYLYYSSDHGVTWEVVHFFSKGFLAKNLKIGGNVSLFIYLQRGFYSSTSFPYISKSTDFGRNWNNVWEFDGNISNFSSNFNSIDFIDSMNGIVSFEKFLLRTNNGGNSWFKEYIPNEYINSGIIKQVIYPDTNLTLLVTNIGKILINKNEKQLVKPEIKRKNSWSNEYLNNLEIKWNSIEGAINYRVIYNGTKKDSTWLVDFNYMEYPLCDTIVNDTSIIISRLEEKYQYSLWVKAIGDNMESEWSTSNRFYTDSLKNGLLQPLIVSPLQYSFIKDSLISIVWNKVPEAESYDIYIRNYLSNYKIEKLDVTDTAIYDLHFPPQDEYTIRIRSKTHDHSKYSSITTITFYRWFALNDTYIHDLEATKSNIFIYPNPAKDYCFISFDSEISDKSKIEIYNITGTIVYSESLDIFTGRNNIPVDLRMFPSGFYTVQIINGNEVKYGAFIK